jgi:hypothetical protein
MNSRRLHLPFAVLCALVLALACAAGASAQVLKGEVVLPENPGNEGEEDQLAASATFDSTTGTLTITSTTRTAPTANEHLSLIGGVLDINAPCTVQGLGEAAAKDPNSGYPAFKMQSAFTAEKLPPGFPQTAWVYATSKKNEEEETEAKHFGTGTRTVEGMKTTIAATAPRSVGGTFTCALVTVSNSLGSPEADFAVFPLVAQPEPPAPVVVPPAVVAPILPKPALALLKSNPLKLKTEKWTTVKFKVSNPGTAAVGPITVKATAPKGVTVQTKSVRLPALLPGQTWPVSFRIKAGDAAKARSQLKLTATAAGLKANASVPIKPTG